MERAHYLLLISGRPTRQQGNPAPQIDSSPEVRRPFCLTFRTFGAGWGGEFEFATRPDFRAARSVLKSSTPASLLQGPSPKPPNGTVMNPGSPLSLSKGRLDPVQRFNQQVMGLLDYPVPTARSFAASWG